MLLPSVMVSTLITLTHCDAVKRGIHAISKAIKTAKERREAEGWKPTSPRGSKRGTERVGRPDRAKKYAS